VLPKPLRATVLACVLSVLALGGSTASASAVETSQITSPTSPTYVLYDETLPQPQIAFTVTGTTTIGENIALRCYWGPLAADYSTIVKEVVPSGGTFSVPVEAKSLGAPCVLRAVPFKNAEAHPPGNPTEEAADPFQGPRVVGSSFEVFPESKAPSYYDYEVETNTLSGYFDLESVGDCGLDYSRLFAATSLVPSDHLFDCNAALYKEDDPPSGSPTRSELQIDGANAYSPAAAESLQKKLAVKIPGAPQVTVTKSFDPLSGLVTVHEIDPIVKCSPETVFPPTSTSCSSFLPTGVQLERSWQTSAADQVAWMTDTWRSTDGAAHSLNALYDQETVNAEKMGGAYEFAGESSFSPLAKGQMVTLPAGPGEILYKEDAETPNVGDNEHPQGAIVYDTPPNGQVSVYRSTEGKEIYNGFEMPYQRTIPVGGAYTIRMAFVQAYKLSEVESLAESAIASYHPTLAITSPASGATVSTPSVTVSGTATDTGALTSLTVNGQSVSVGAGGAWSTSVTLSPGANTIKAIATDQAGLTVEKAVSVTYTPAPPPPRAHQVGSASGANGAVTFTIACVGEAGSSCEVESTISTVERKRHGRPVAVSARHHPRTSSERITVGSSKVTIPAGQRIKVSIGLNAAGRNLLARFGALPVHLSVVQWDVAPRATIVVIEQNLTVRAHRRRHHHHHHH
jgi:hypothetical protein